MAIRGLGSFDMMSNYNRIDFRERSITAASEANQEILSAVNSIVDDLNSNAVQLKSEN